MKKNTVEIFAGTGSFSKVAKARGYKTLTLDNDRQHNTDIERESLATAAGL